MRIGKRTWTWQGVTHHAWRVDWIDQSGRRCQRQFKSKVEADLFRDKVVRERYSARYDTLVDTISFKDFLPIYEAKKSWRTDSYRVRVLSALGIVSFKEKPIAAITTADIEAYRDARAKKSAAATVRMDLAALADCFKWAVKLKYAHENPAKAVERPVLAVKQDDPVRHMTREQFDALLAAAKKDRPLYEFAVYTGLRITELIALEWPDVRDGYVLVRRGKGRKQRLVPLLPQAIAALKTVPKRLNDHRVFWWMRDRHTTLRRFQRRLAWAELPPFRFHDLRHTFGSWAAMSGVHLEVIGAAMGHTSTIVTKKYAHLSPDYKRAELLKMADFGTRKGQRLRKHAKAKGSHQS